ncbi:nicotinamide riboside transporter PnuC [Ruminococcus sp. HUN007]|uniref:nicotinamide riboside transporter PnuC n=1 Tax=Ruminococcus sp. HUN007 TaxID=1514668 RepID=UPI0005D2548D|nr:nicotinamide riboside transporter PnuC [Ruminococcus sp. HUN007]
MNENTNATAAAKFTEFIRNELKGWKAGEIFWLIFANAALLAISLYLHDTPVSILASLTGVTCVILVGKGKMSNYIFGTVNVLLYACVAWKAKYYGDVMLNLAYYFPTNILGWFMWKKNIDTETQVVQKKRMTVRQDIAVAVLSAAGIFGYSWVLKLLGGNLPLVDSMSTVLSVVAQILMIKRFTEQWIVWILVDAVSVIMWVVAFMNEGDSVAVLLMWIIFLLNAVIMFIKWYRESAEEKTENPVKKTVQE